MVFKIRFDLISILLLVLLAAEMIVSVMYLDPDARHLIAGELAFQFTFGLAGYRIARYIIYKQDSKKPAGS
jgi:hypothetical protein